MKRLLFLLASLLILIFGISTVGLRAAPATTETLPTATFSTVQNADGTYTSTVTGTVSTARLLAPPPTQLTDLSTLPNRIYLPMVGQNFFAPFPITVDQKWREIGYECRTDPDSWEKQRTAGVFRTCWYIYKLEQGPDPNRDFWAIAYKGSVQGPWGSAPIPGLVTKAMIQVKQAVPDPVPPEASEVKWYDYEPKSSHTDSCISTSVSISREGLGISLPLVLCGYTNPIYRGDTPTEVGWMEVRWEGLLPAFYPESRELALISAVSAPKGYNITWQWGKSWVWGP